MIRLKEENTKVQKMEKNIDFFLEKALVENNEVETDLFFGRKDQLKTLQQEFDKPNLLGSHWGVYGVRRSGKTALIQYFISQKEKELAGMGERFFTFSITGKKEKTTIQNAEQALKELIYSVNVFLEENDLIEQKVKYESQLRLDNPDYWERFFECLVISIKFIKTVAGDIRFFCFFDEIAWLSKDNSFVEAYSIYLNQNKVSLQKVMNFLACSSNSWIKSRIFKNTTGFFERFRRLKVEPFSFAEIKSFFALQGWINDDREILKYYLLFGGFVKYYKEIELDFSQPFINNVERLIEKTPYLREEFDVFFQGIFSDRKLYKEIVKEVLSTQTMSLEELFEKMTSRYNKNRKTIERQITELKQTGVLKETEFLGEKRVYCCLQHFHLFYRFLNEKKITAQSIYQWRGDMFELYVLDNLEFIAKKLGITGDLDVKINVKLTKQDSKEVLAQYDLVIEEKGKNWRAERDRTFYTMELKFHDSQNYVSSEYIKQVKRKANALRIYYEHILPIQKGRKVSVKPLIVTTNQTGADVFNIFDGILAK